MLKVMLKNARHTELIVALMLIGLSVLSRFLPHPPNFSPVLGAALFSGSVFASRRLAFFIPLAALLISDFLLGYYDGIAFVYGAYMLTVALGVWIQASVNGRVVGQEDARVVGQGARLRVVATLAAATLAASTVFFFLSNFGVWLFSGLYEKTWTGFVQCYMMALPFFHHTVISTFVTTAVLFGVYMKVLQWVGSQALTRKVSSWEVL